MKRPYFVMHECNTQRTRVLPTTNTQYRDIGEWVLKSMESMVKACAAEDTKPCIHIMPRKLTKEEFDQLDKVDWQLEKGKLIRDVERGAA